MSDLFSLETLRAAAELLARSRQEIRVAFCGSSMRPTIASESQVVVQCGIEPSADAVFVVVLPDRLLVHRIVGIDRDWILTCGDANPIPDPPLIREGRVDVGVVSGVVEGERVCALPPFQATGIHRLLRTVCSRIVRLDRRLGSSFIQLLWFVRRWLWLWPKVHLLRVLRGRSAGEAQASPRGEE